ncbi:MAG: UDP-N-acetylmuramoyl-L-alanyl-D-glutamate--2,6-diaminopimelate ligase [Thermodesulfobacteriota bacterium]
MALDSAKTTKTLQELISGTDIEVAPADLNLQINGIEADSRKCGPGKLFVAVKGDTFDGHDFLEKSVDLGCVAVVVEQKLSAATFHELGVVVLVATDSRQALADLVANFYDHPDRQLKMIGITGTNGKTTTSYLLESIILAGGGEPGVIGTVSYRFRGREEGAPFTTPEPLALYRMMREMVNSGVDHLIMEVSSHALIQKRLHGIKFDVAAFTNLSHEHLDFHGDMDAYFAAKSILFTGYLQEDGVAVVMLTDEEDPLEQEMAWGDRLVNDLCSTGRFRKYGEGISPEEGGLRNLLLTCGRQRGDVHVKKAEITLEGIKAEIIGLADEVFFESPLVGDFNLLNMATAIAIGHVLGLSGRQIGQGLAETANVPGRLERVRRDDGGKDDQCRVFVDFAHTPDALSGVLQSVRNLCRGRLLVVFGCGGDRDQAKRPIMGEIAARLADVVIITTDNSRSEPPLAIMADIEEGLMVAGHSLLPKKRVQDLLASAGKGYEVIESRREAISLAIRSAAIDDVVLICGKGHETYQLVGNKRYFFDDRFEAARQLAEG